MPWLRGSSLAYIAAVSALGLPETLVLVVLVAVLSVQCIAPAFRLHDAVLLLPAAVRPGQLVPWSGHRFRILATAGRQVRPVLVHQHRALQVWEQSVRGLVHNLAPPPAVGYQGLLVRRHCAAA